MANIFNANHVVLYNPGQYQSMQEEFFINRIDAEKFVKAFRKRNPNGQARIAEWNKEEQKMWEEPDFLSI